MINNILDGISLTLKAHYPSYKIYTNEVPQGFKQPCFFIKLMTTGRQKQIGPYHNVRYQYTIRYYSDAQDKNEDCYEMEEVLYTLFQFLQNRRLRGSDITGRVVEGVLHFFITFTVRMKHVIDEGPTLNDLELALAPRVELLRLGMWKLNKAQFVTVVGGSDSEDD